MLLTHATVPRMKGQNKSKFLEHGCSQHTVDMGVYVGLSLHYWFRSKGKKGRKVIKSCWYFGNAVLQL